MSKRKDYTAYDFSKIRDSYADIMVESSEPDGRPRLYEGKIVGVFSGVLYIEKDGQLKTIHPVKILGLQSGMPIGKMSVDQLQYFGRTGAIKHQGDYPSEIKVSLISKNVEITMSNHFDNSHITYVSCVNDYSPAMDVDTSEWGWLK